MFPAISKTNFSHSSRSILMHKQSLLMDGVGSAALSTRMNVVLEGEEDNKKCIQKRHVGRSSMTRCSKQVVHVEHNRVGSTLDYGCSLMNFLIISFICLSMYFLVYSRSDLIGHIFML